MPLRFIRLLLAGSWVSTIRFLDWFAVRGADEDDGGPLLAACNWAKVADLCCCSATEEAVGGAAFSVSCSWLPSGCCCSRGVVEVTAAPLPPSCGSADETTGGFAAVLVLHCCSAAFMPFEPAGHSAEGHRSFLLAWAVHWTELLAQRCRTRIEHLCHPQ